jgi:chromosome segregation ATPase
MPDEPKRPPSTSSRRVRHDTRAEPDSAALPEPEAMATLGRRSDGAPAGSRKLLVGGASTRPTRPETAQQVAPRRPRTGADALREPNGPVSEGPGDIASLRRQIATLQQELSQTQRRLSSAQEERNEEADRLSEMLARVTTLEASHLDVLAVKAELEKERETSQWLREAGALATREVAALRARPTLSALEATADPAVEQAAAAELTALTEEVTRLKADIETANAMQELARGRETTLRAEVTTATARATALASELAEATAYAAGQANAALAVKLEEATAEANAALATKLEEANAQAAAEATTLRTKLEEAQAEAAAVALASVTKLEEAKANATAEATASAARHAKALAAANAEAETALGRVREEHAEALARAARDHAAKLADATKATETRMRALGDELTATMTAMSTLKAQNESFQRAVEHADTRSVAATAQLEQTTATLATLMRSFEALEQTEARIDALREDARTARATFSDQTVTLRVALSRASDAVTTSRPTSGEHPAGDGAAVPERKKP